MSNLSKETIAHIQKDAVNYSKLFKYGGEYREPAYADGALHEAGRAQQEIAQLKRWKAEASELLNPILDYGQSEEAGIPLGESITATVLERCKRFHVAQQEIESLTNQLKGHASVSNENMKLLRQENETRKAKLEKYEKALKEINGSDGKLIPPKHEMIAIANEALSGEGKEVEKTFTVDQVDKMLIEFALMYHKNPQKDIANDAAEYLSDKLKEDKQWPLKNY